MNQKARFCFSLILLCAFCSASAGVMACPHEDHDPPADANAWDERARCQLKEGSCCDAITSWTNLLALDPDRHGPPVPDIYRRLAVAQNACGQVKEAIKSLETFFERAPPYAPFRHEAEIRMQALKQALKNPRRPLVDRCIHGEASPPPPPPRPPPPLPPPPRTETFRPSWRTPVAAVLVLGAAGLVSYGSASLYLDGTCASDPSLVPSLHKTDGACPQVYHSLVPGAATLAGGIALAVIGTVIFALPKEVRLIRLSFDPIRGEARGGLLLNF